ncbi:MAG: hypothetical protein HC767_00035 [Akkermansiaceae bacterium]|nr:hypothetical protein [Akkermansiaceae bacterium]
MLQVLQKNFPGVDIAPDIRQLDQLPTGVRFLTAGFPCTNLSSMGKMEVILEGKVGLTVTMPT